MVDYGHQRQRRLERVVPDAFAFCRLSEGQQAKIAGPVEGWGFTGDRVPGQKMGLGRQVAALEKVGAHGSAGGGGEAWEEPPDEFRGNAVSDFPAAAGAPGLGLEQCFLLRQKAYQVVDAAADAQVRSRWG